MITTQFDSRLADFPKFKVKFSTLKEAPRRGWSNSQLGGLNLLQHSHFSPRVPPPIHLLTIYTPRGVSAQRELLRGLHCVCCEGRDKRKPFRLGMIAAMQIARQSWRGCWSIPATLSQFVLLDGWGRDPRPKLFTRYKAPFCRPTEEVVHYPLSALPNYLSAGLAGRPINPCGQANPIKFSRLWKWGLSDLYIHAQFTKSDLPLVF